MKFLTHEVYKRPLYVTDNLDVIRTIPSEDNKSFIGFMKVSKNEEVPVPTSGIVLTDTLLSGREITKEEYDKSDGGVKQDI